MTAKMDLLAKLTALMPECAGEIAKILHDYEIMPAKVYERSNLPRRVDAFLAAKRIDGCRPRTLEGYRERLKVLIGRCKKPVQKITTDDLREHIAYLVDERHLKDNSVQAHINCLRSFFQWLTDEDAIRKNPMRKIKSLKIDKLRSRHPLTAEQLELVRDGCRGYKEKALVEFLVSSGCRVSEVAGLRVDDIDWRDRKCKVIGKGNKERMLPVPAKLASALRKRTGVWLFPGDVQGHCGVDYVAKRIKTVTGYPSHSLRRRFATCVYYRNGCNIVLVSRMLGHANIATTMRYIGLVQDEMRNAVESTTRTDMRLTMPMNQVVGTAGSVATYSLSTARIG